MKLTENILNGLPEPKREFAEIIHAALEAANPDSGVKRNVRIEGDDLQIGEQHYPLDRIKNIYLIAFGKAAIPMSTAVMDILGERITAGVVITKHLPTSIEESRLAIFTGGHPIPDERSLAGTRAVFSLLSNLSENDLVLCLVSGGGSALLTRPREGVSLHDLQDLIGLLLQCGATIQEINTLRKHLDVIKGGGLARLASQAQMAVLILSDVVGSPLDVIASGPTVPDPSTYQDAWEILERYQILSKVPAQVLQVLERGRSGQLAETAKPGEAFFERVQNLIVADNYRSVLASLEAARQRGFSTLLLSTFIQGEARVVGRVMAGIIKEMAASGKPLPRPALIVAGGETTVTLCGKGRGGRNLEVALGAVRELAGEHNVLLVTLATDGEDGPTDAAGAAVDGQTYERSRQAHLNVDQYLKDNNSYSFFEKVGGIIKIGPTGTNVNDLIFLFIY